MAAITAMKTIGFKKLKLTSRNPNQANAPSPRRNPYKNQLTGAVIVNTKITANPKPMEASTFFETARTEKGAGES